MPRVRREGGLLRLGTVSVLVLAATLGEARVRPRPAWPTSISDKEYWGLLTKVSEDGGAFVSDNIISNEIAYQQAVPDAAGVPAGRTYLGVGPEQNFTYIAASRPAVAFVVDLQRSNMYVHLLYKALLEISHSRSEFLSLLFARAIPDLPPGTTLTAMLAAYRGEAVSRPLAIATGANIMHRLETVHGFPLKEDDRLGITRAYRTFYSGGPGLKGDFGGGAWIPSFGELATATDLAGRNRGFLATDDVFRTVQQYERRNLIVPIVGDFSGTKALRAVSDYSRRRGLIVGLFYVSNVEEYLFKAGTWRQFVANLATMPLDSRSLVVRTFFTHSSIGLQTLLDSPAEMVRSGTRGEVRTYEDLIRRSRMPGRQADVGRDPFPRH